MKCMTCNECSDKKYCAILNGLSKAPFPLGAYKIKGCHESNIEELRRIKEKENAKCGRNEKMDSMEIRDKLRKDKNCKDYVVWCLACYLMGAKFKMPKKRHLKKAEKKLNEYMSNAWLIENKVEKYVREN